MNVLAVFCHPNHASFSGAVLDRFVAGAEAAGHLVEIADLYREGFDPVMSQRDLEQFNGVPMTADVLAEQARVENADALCLIYPTWWYGMPAMMKGWLDRVWSAGWAYEWKHDPEGSLLEPRPITLLLPTGASRRLIEKHGIEPHLEHILSVGVFGYCGVEPIRIHLLLDSIADPGPQAEHLDTAFQAGKQIGEIENYRVENTGGRNLATD